MRRDKATTAIHGRKDSLYRGANFPIYTSTTFAVEKSDDYDKFIGDEEEFYIYSRYSLFTPLPSFPTITAMGILKSTSVIGRGDLPALVAIQYPFSLRYVITR